MAISKEVTTTYTCNVCAGSQTPNSSVLPEGWKKVSVTSFNPLPFTRELIICVGCCASSETEALLALKAFLVGEQE